MNSRNLKIAGISLVSVLVIFFVYRFFFGSATSLYRLIPKDSYFVMNINIREIAKKLDLVKIRNSSIYAKYKEEVSWRDKDLLQIVFDSVLHDPKKSGIDFGADACIYGFEKGHGKYIAMAFAIDSKSKFDKLIDENLTKENKQYNKGDLNIIELDNRSLLGYDGNHAIILNTERYDNVREKSVEKTLLYLFDLHRDENFNKNIASSKFASTKGDITWFVDMQQIIGENMPKKSEGKKYFDFNLLSSLNFNQDNFELNTDFVFETEDVLKDVKSIITKHGISREHLPFLSNGKILGLMSLSFDFKQFIEVFGAKYEKELGRKLLEEGGLTMEDYKNLYTGDVSLALLDVKSIMEEYENMEYDAATKEYKTVKIQRPKFQPVFTATMGINDKAVLKKLLKTVIEKNPGANEEFGRYNEINNSFIGSLYYVVNGNYFTLINDSAMAYKLKNEGKLGDSPDAMKAMVCENSFSFFLDLDTKKYPEELKTKYLESSYMREISKPFFSNINSISITGNDQHGQIKINLVPGNENSLVRLFNAVDEQIKNEYEQQRIRTQELERERAIMDSLNSISTPDVVEETQEYSPKH